MNIKTAKEIILYVVQTTETRWRKYDESWANIDEILIRRGYEQGGFETFKLVPLFKENEIYTIQKLGSIMDGYKGKKKYQREYAGSLESDFYLELKENLYGQAGKSFYLSVEEFLNTKTGKTGSRFWLLLWQMLICTHHLKENCNSSFSYYLRSKFSSFKGNYNISDENILKCGEKEWTDFKTKTKPWKELYGIGENVFDFILADLTEANGITEASFKLDTNNIYFFKVTGISELIKKTDRENIINFIHSMDTKYSLREINKGIYTYCSLTESHNFGFCRNKEKCMLCTVNNLCAKNI